MSGFSAVPPPMPIIKKPAIPANPFVGGGGLITHDPYILFPDVFSDIMREADKLTEMARDKLSVCADNGVQRDAIAWHKQAILGQNLKLATIQTMAKSQEVAELRKRNNEVSSGGRHINEVNGGGNMLDTIDPKARQTVVDIIARRIPMEQVVDL